MKDEFKNLPDADTVIELFNIITADRSLGSRELVTTLLEELLVWGLEIDFLPEEGVESICGKITKLRPEMAIVSNTGYLLWSQYRNGSKNDNLANFKDGLRKLRADHETADENIIENHAKSALKDKDVMTFSRSSTVLKLLLNAQTTEKSVVLHSYPGEEGIDLVEDLDEAIEVTFAFDVEAGYFLPRVDALYLGVDAIFKDGSIVNKTGSRLLARSARDVTPVRVVTDVWKLAREEAITNVPRYPSPKSLPEKLQREHPLFETIPAELIDTYITNRGIFNSVEKLQTNLVDLQKAHRKFSK